MDFLLELHTDMFLGLPGMLFLGAMGVLFVAALVSGVVLYAPFMRKLDFGTLRTTRSHRLKWLDWHNLLGITAFAWMAARMPPAKLRGEFDEIEKSVRYVVDRMPSHADYVARYCPTV